MKKIISILCLVVSVVLVAIACLIHIPPLFGYETVHTTSDDMSPSIRAGSLCYITTATMDSLAVDDIVAIRLPDESTILRRIVHQKPEDGAFLTKGDHVELIDTTILEESSLRGVSSFSIPLVGYVATFQASMSGLIAYISLTLVLLLTSLFLLFKK